MTTEYYGCPACGRAEEESTRHCEHGRCDQLECTCGRIYESPTHKVGA